MEKIINSVALNIFNLRFLFSGFNLETKSSEIEYLTNEIKNLNITTFADDKANLKDDINNVAKDYHKAFSEKELIEH